MRRITDADSDSAFSLSVVESVRWYEMWPSWNSRCAACIVRSVENPSLRLASCVSVEVVNGGAGRSMPGFSSTDVAVTGFGSRDDSNAFVAKLRLSTAGSEAADTPGAYVAATGAWFLRNSNSAGGADVTFTYGGGGPGLVPIAGDWDGDGDDTPGLYDPSTGAFFLKNSNAAGAADLVFTFGAGGAAVQPITGDWDGDGDDTVGLYDSGSGAFFLRNANAPGPADLFFSYGPANATPLAGDWNNDGADTVGVYVPASGAWFLRNSNSPGAADVVFTYGPPNVTPVAGDWNGATPKR